MGANIDLPIGEASMGDLLFVWGALKFSHFAERSQQTFSYQWRVLDVRIAESGSFDVLNCPFILLPEGRSGGPGARNYRHLRSFLAHPPTEAGQAEVRSARFLVGRGDRLNKQPQASAKECCQSVTSCSTPVANICERASGGLCPRQRSVLQSTSENGAKHYARSILTVRRP